jgi:hypothetical protein
MRPLLVALAGALLLASSASAAGPPALPTETFSLTASGTTARSCHTSLLAPGTAGVARRTWTAKAVGAASLRLTGATRRGDWDLAVFDGAGRALGGSVTFAAEEVVQRWVNAGDVLTLQACRRSGAGSSVPGSADLVLGALPTAGATPQLLRVGITENWQLELLEDLGLDVTHHKSAQDVDVIVDGPAQLELVKKTGFPFTTRVADLNRHYFDARRQDAAFSAQGNSALPTGRTDYRAYEDFGTEMKALVSANPKLVKPITLPGTSFQGRPLDGVEIADGVNDPEDGRPVSMVVAVHHAREWPAAETAMEYMHHLVQSYGKDARVTDLLKRVRVVIVPLINPDGYVYTRGAYDTQDSAQYTALAASGSQAYRRKNCNGVPSPEVPCDTQHGVDPNRNYGSGWGGQGASANRESQTYRGAGPFSEPETQAVQKFGQTRQITNMITLHNVAALVLRPPGRSSDGLAPDEVRLKALGDKIQSVTGYRSQYGWQLYDTSGTTEDWFYDAFGTFGYTIEIGPANGMFHMPYETGVVNEWLGMGEREDGLKGVEGKGMKEALLVAAEQATDAQDHGVVAGRAPAGRTLRIKKEFKSSTSPVCQVTVSFPIGFVNPPLSEVTAERCEAVTDPILFDDKLETTMTVPAGNRFEYHVNPSTRPFVGRTGKTESFKLTCENDGKVIESADVVVPRGGTLTADLPCGGKLPDPPAEAPKGCEDALKPLTTLRSVSISRKKKRVAVTGRSIDQGCAGVGRVVVAVGRQVRKNVCSFMDARGKFGKPKRCNRPLYLKATGSGPWRFTKSTRLRKGSYLVFARAFDLKNNREAVSLRVNGKRVRVR